MHCYYLYYAVKNMKLAKYYTGATIPHIYYKDYKIESFWLRGIPEQQQIVTILEKVEKVIGEFIKVKNRLDDLVQSKVSIQKALDKTQTLLDSLMQQYFG